MSKATPNELCRRLLAEARRRKTWMTLTPLLGVGNTWFVAADGTRLCITQDMGDEYTINVVPIRKERVAATWVLYGDGESRNLTNGPVGSGKPLPPELHKALESALPLPRTESMYGVREGGRIIALVWLTQDYRFADVPLAPSFTLWGERTPALFLKFGGRKHLNMRRWWQLVDQGKIVDLTQQARDSRTLLYNDRHGYILVEGEDWPGVGDALYLSDSPRCTMTLDQAKAQGGYDLRRRFS